MKQLFLASALLLTACTGTETISETSAPGPLSNKAELGESIKRLQAIHDRVKARKDAGESLEVIIAADPLADMTNLESFMKKPDVITATWRSLGGK